VKNQFWFWSKFIPVLVSKQGSVLYPVPVLSVLDILTRRYAIGDVCVHKFSGKVNSCCEPVYNFHRMKTHIHVHQHLEVTAPSNMPCTISIENTMHLLS
jgi:hypothetical protein